MKICLFIYAPQKGLLVSLGKELEARGHDAVFLARDVHVEAVIRQHFPGLGPDRIMVLNNLEVHPGDNLIGECLKREKEYGETFAMLASRDRALGKGYLLNAPGHPDIVRAWWNKERKYAELLKQYLCYEAVLDRFAPDMVMGVGVAKAAHLICRNRGIPVRILTPPRFGSLYRWTVDETEQCPPLTIALKRRAEEFAASSDLPETKLEQTAFARYFFAKIRYDYATAVKAVLRQVMVEGYQLWRHTHKQFSGGYRFLGWNGPILRKPYIYKYFLRYGMSPSDLAGSRMALFPLHYEPEGSLLDLAPEMNNSIELITWVSKSLPADAVLVVKEQPDSFGIRTRAYYDNLRRMANVVIAHPHVHGKEWLAHCDLVTAITSTMGFEAVAMERPVLSFGAHQVINALPTVEFADSFLTTRKAVRRLLDSSIDMKRSLQISRAALNTAFKDVCFDLSGYEAIFKSNDLHMDLARVALDNLAREFPALGSLAGQSGKHDG